MTFTEFLNAMGKEQMLHLIQNHDWQMIRDFEEQVCDLLRYYYYVGGMPEVVDTFVSTMDFNQARSVQKALLADFKDDFGKHASLGLKPRIEKKMGQHSCATRT